MTKGERRLGGQGAWFHVLGTRFKAAATKATLWAQKFVAMQMQTENRVGKKYTLIAFVGVTVITMMITNAFDFNGRVLRAVRYIDETDIKTN